MHTKNIERPTLLVVMFTIGSIGFAFQMATIWSAYGEPVSVALVSFESGDEDCFPDAFDVLATEVHC